MLNFVSIHANTSGHSSRARGFETYLLRPGKTEDAIEVAEANDIAVFIIRRKDKDFEEYTSPAFEELVTVY